MMKINFIYSIMNIIAAFGLVFGVGSILISTDLVFAAQDEEAAQTSSGSQIFLPVVGRAQARFDIITPQIGVFDKFEFQFDISTSAANPSLPYDPNPPPGIQPGIGVNVDVLFSYDNWQTAIVQPAFLNQGYRHSVQNSKDHFIPEGSPRWTVRFTPQRAGNWQYRVRVEDSGGVRHHPDLISSAYTLSVAEQTNSRYARNGFLRVSTRDPRYFEFQDGTPFIGVGFNEGFSTTSKVSQSMKAWEENKMNFIRVWMSGSGINGSQWTSWASHHVGNDGYIPGVSLDIHNTYKGSDVSLRLSNNNPCLYGDFWQNGIPVQPNTNYTVWARVKLNNVTGPAASGDYGFVIKQAGWLGKDCAKGGGGVITPFTRGSTDWIEVSGTYQTGSTQHWLDNLYLTMQNARDGNVYIDEVRVYRTDDPHRVNILREPYANSHLYFDPMNSALWDKFIETAERHGVYLKLVIDEKNEWIRNRIDSNGKIVERASNDNFYASPGTKGRWLQEAWWRYIIARWGYSTSIHSFEYINEGDPYNGRHHEAANAMGRYFRENNPSRHMVTTSFWSAFPNKEVWSNPNYQYLDYASIHAYISTGWGLTPNLLHSHRVETNPAHIRFGNGSARIAGTDNDSQGIAPRGLVIQGQGEWIIRYWMKAESFSANCQHGSSGGMQRVRWSIDGGKFSGGKEGIVPGEREGKDFICTSPAGTFDWRQFTSDKDRNGNQIPAEYRLIINDDKPHELSIRIENNWGRGGTAWIDGIELVSPSGEVADVLGYFDNTPMDADTAWYNYAYGKIFGGGSLVGARKPLVRGETGIDYEHMQDWNRDLLKDTDGIWIHNNIWGQINPGGMYDLFWWSSETIRPDIYYHFQTFRNFMADIPLSNGHYYGVSAQTSNSNLRAWGQRDDHKGRMHLWLQNTQHTWKRVVNGPAISAISGTVTIQNVPSGQYKVEWWDTYKTSNPIFRTETLNSNGNLTLTLPQALSKDVAVKIQRVP
jgi:hypothetical protein